MATSGRPNILIFISHDTGRCIEPYRPDFRTPNLMRLAERGARFERYFCPAAQCSPSRASIMTGLLPHRHGLMGLAHLGWSIAEDVRCMPQVLAENGYRTYLFGLQHEATDAGRLGYQFIDERRDLSVLVPAVVDFLRREGANANAPPFFAVVGFSQTHRPFDAYTDVTDAVPDVPPYLPDEHPIREDLRAFHGSVQTMDQAVGQMLDALDISGLAARTVVIYTTDHGIAFPRCKGTGYDTGLETALLIMWQGVIRPGAVFSELLSNVDLMPTLLEIAGAAVPSRLDGRSFAALLRGEPYVERDAIFFEMTWHDRYNPLRGIRTRRYKYIRNYDPEAPLVYIPADIYRGPSGIVVRDAYYGSVRPEEELYDLAADPWEMENCIGRSEYESIRRDLAARLERMMTETGDPLLRGHVLPPREQAQRTRRLMEDPNRNGPITSLERELTDRVLQGA